MARTVRNGSNVSQSRAFTADPAAPGRDSLQQFLSSTTTVTLGIKRQQIRKRACAAPERHGTARHGAARSGGGAYLSQPSWLSAQTSLGKKAIIKGGLTEPRWVSSHHFAAGESERTAAAAAADCSAKKHPGKCSLSSSWNITVTRFCCFALQGSTLF